MIPSLIEGGGYMGGSVLQDKSTGRYYVQIYWHGKKERFFRFESKDKWYPFDSDRHARKVLAIMQGQVVDILALFGRGERI